MHYAWLHIEGDYPIMHRGLSIVFGEDVCCYVKFEILIVVIFSVVCIKCVFLLVFMFISIFLSKVLSYNQRCYIQFNTIVRTRITINEI